MSPFAFVLLAAVAVPPGEPVVEHTQPYHYGQPVIRTFERKEVDAAREANWHLYVQELDELWLDYREANSTPRAWRIYKRAAAEAKRRYVYADPYLVPIPTQYEW